MSCSIFFKNKRKKKSKRRKEIFGATFLSVFLKRDELKQHHHQSRKPFFNNQISPYANLSFSLSLSLDPMAFFFKAAVSKGRPTSPVDIVRSIKESLLALDTKTIAKVPTFFLICSPSIMRICTTRSC